MKEFFKNLFRKKTKIDKLARRKKNLVLERDKLLRDMRNRNSKRETKIDILTNAGQTDFENTNKKVDELNLLIDKARRDIDSEQTYVNEVADREKQEYIKTQIEEQRKIEKQQKFKGDKIND